jgi:small subunit ribosomal protein S4e
VKGGKLQVNLTDGRNILMDKTDVKVNDSILIEVPAQKAKQRLPLEAGAHILLMGGKHIGSVGVVQSVAGDVVTYAHGKETRRTRPEYAYVVPKEIHVLMEHEQHTGA